jgi:carboxylesterase type B
MISRRGVLTSAAAGLRALPRASRSAGGLVVETPHGRLRGVRADGVVSFKGVRYGSGPDIPRLVRQTISCRASFAHHGVPAELDAVQWAPYDGAGGAMMMLDVESHMEKNRGGEARQAVGGLRYFDDS